MNRTTLFERCFGHCEVGGEPLGDAWAVHHRKLRSRGGNNAAENLMAVCHSHHNLATNSIHLRPARATAYGWMVQAEMDPAEVMLKVFDYWTYLGKDGTYHQPSPALEEVIRTLSGR